MKVVIEARGVEVVLGGKTILQDVSFDVQEGESLTLVGPNGAGKTTLLRCLAGLVLPAAGEILLDGTDLRRWSRRRVARRIAYVAQGGEAPACTAYEFVLMARYAHLNRIGGIRTADREAAHEALAATGTADFQHQPMKTLSGGQRQKVLIAAALAQEASILLLDEPATYLDYRHQAEVLDLIERLHRGSGYTVITVSHDLNQGALESDRVLALSDGRVVLDGRPGDLARPEVLNDVFHTPFDVFVHHRSGRTLVVPLRNRS